MTSCKSFVDWCGNAAAGVVMVCGLVGFGAAAARAESPLELLRRQPRPKFRQGHTLPPLSRWGWAMPFEVRVELCEHWGYGLELGGVSERTLQQLEDPQSETSRLVALTKSNPKKYPLCVITPRPLLSGEFRAGLPEAAWCRGADGKPIEDPHKVLSPQAPDAVFQQTAALTAEPLRQLRRQVPIAIIHNGGEYGLGVFGFSGKAWRQDPEVVQAKGVKSWFAHLSERKARQEEFVSRAVREAVPDRLLYIYYPTSGCPHRNRSDDWWQWAYGYEWMKPISDVPNGESYYLHFNTGWTGQIDMLTLALNSVGLQIAQGEPLSYNWLCAGWTRKDLGEKAFGDVRHYLGFLKCYYTAGMIGGVAGYFAYPEGGFKAPDVGDQMPGWLAQMVVLGRAHALFSHLEDNLRNGELLPGPRMHRWSKERPAYEIPTGDPDARVVARRHRQRAEWLITAWAAGGKDREVSVEILGLGTVKLLARDCGTVYLATLQGGKPAVRLLDRDGMRPAAAM